MGMLTGLPTLSRYPAYRPSDVAWLGDVPKHWKVLPGKACYSLKQVPNKGMQEATVLSLSYGQIKVKPEEKLHGLVPASFETYQVVEPGDIICRPTDLQNDWASLRFGLSQHRGIITSAYMCFHTCTSLEQEYGYALLHAYDLKKVFYGLGSGLRQNLSWSDFKSLPCLVPPVSDQIAIVRYLDHVDRRISRYIRAKQRLIELLEEEKQVIIHRAVTRGLDLDVPLKPSGVEWLGDVPEHWEVRRFWEVVDTRSEKNRPELDLLSVFLGRGVIPYGQGGGQVHKPSLDLSGYQTVYPGDLVLNNQQAWRGSLGVSSHCGIISPAYLVFSLSVNVNPQFANYLFQSRVMVAQFVMASKGVGDIQRDVHTPWLKNTRVPVPHLPEQTAIARYLDKTTADIDATIGRARREIELLGEYRTRLIADVVTGKLDVREVAADLPEVDPSDLEDIIEIDELTADELAPEVEEVAP